LNTDKVKETLKLSEQDILELEVVDTDTTEEGKTYVKLTLHLLFYLWFNDSRENSSRFLFSKKIWIFLPGKQVRSYVIICLVCQK
jgi:hypothetical protein